MIESMIVVTIIGIMAAAAMPAMTEMVASSRQQGVAVDLMLLARRARAEAMFGGYANMITFDQGAGAGDGAAAWLTGLTSSCFHGNGVLYAPGMFGLVYPVGWQPIFPPPMGALALRSAQLGSHRVFGRMEMPAGTVRNGLSICYHPSGRTWVLIPGNGAPAVQTASATLFVRRSVNGNIRGVDRELVFPPSGTARLR